MASVLFFLVYGVLGWAMDSLYWSATSKKWGMGNVLAPLPFSPIYGFGALIVIGLANVLQDVPWIAKGVFLGIVLATYEWVGGHVSLWLFKRRLWSYGNARSPFDGFTDGWHVVVWGTLALVMISFVHPYVRQGVALLLSRVAGYDGSI